MEIKEILFMALLFLIVLGGPAFFMGRASVSTCTQSSSQKIENFMNGKDTFCQLTEMERFVVCPQLRLFANLPEGGTTLSYMCNEDTAYIEVNDLSEESKQIVMSRFKQAEGRFNISEHCRIKEHTIVYKSVSKNER